MFCVQELDIWLWNLRHTFIIKEASLLSRCCEFADKHKEKSTQKKENEKVRGLAVARTEQSIMEYYTGASYLYSKLQSCNITLLIPL